MKYQFSKYSKVVKSRYIMIFLGSSLILREKNLFFVCLVVAFYADALICGIRGPTATQASLIGTRCKLF